MWGIRALLLLAVGLVLADASVVTLGLPPIIAELDASVEQAAAVLGVYTLALAVALLDAGGAGRRAWTATAIFGFAAGPALGGALTQAFDWRAIFLVQFPLAAAAAIAAWRLYPAYRGKVATRSGNDRIRRAAFLDARRLGPAAALALLSAALVGVLFLLVLLLVTGWSVSPLAAAAAVTVLPIAAVAASRIGGPARTRAAAGAFLVAGGVLALISLPGANLLWTVLPQLTAGAGLGLALPALARGPLPADTPPQAASLLSLRHAGITAALIVLAPVAAAQLDEAVADTRLQGTALVLDARLPPLEKLALAGTLIGDIDPVDPRGELQASLEDARTDDPAFDALARRADETLVAGVQDAFAPALAICGVLALLAAFVLLPWDRRVLAAAAAAAVLAGGARLALP